MIPGIVAGNPTPAVPPSVDPYWANVVSLLHFDGADASTTFTDQTGKVWTVSGNAQIDTAQFKFGGASGRFDGSGDFISTADSTDWFLEGGDFTIEMWVRPNSIGTRQFLCGQGNVGATDFRNLCEITEAGRFRYGTGVSGFTIDLTGTTTMSVGTWYHISVTKAGTTWRLFVNGSLEASTTNAASITDFAGTFVIGRLGSLNNLYTNGWIDDFRCTKGVARYTASFTPPTSPFPAG